jgi:hypothetical protein
MAPPPKPAAPKNGNRIIGGNRGALGSHLLNMANPNHVPTCNSCMQLIRGNQFILFWSILFIKILKDLTI